IALFHVLIHRDNGDTITYPNNLMLQKAVLKLADQTPLAERQALLEGKKKFDPE
ncbi:MAG: mechanosensitive ion channel family protein, partial [Shewanella oncorhynchi]